MYDSRSSHPRNRGSRWDRHWGDDNNRAATKAFERTLIEESLVSITPTEKASTRIDLDRLHAEALEQHRDWLEEQEADLSYHLYAHAGIPGADPLAMWEWQLLTGQDHVTDEYDAYVDEFYQQAKALEYDEAAVWDESDDMLTGYSHDDCWLPYATVEQCREIFGGTDFIIQHTNRPRRTA